MQLEEFIHNYCDGGYRGYVEVIFEMKEGVNSGIPIPVGFELLKEICRYPEYSIFVNEQEKAILRCEESEYSLSIYDNIVVWEEVIKEHKQNYRTKFGSM